MDLVIRITYKEIHKEAHGKVHKKHMRKGGILINNAMDFNYMTKTCHEMAKAARVQEQTRTQSMSADAAGFADKFLEKSGGKEELTGIGRAVETGFITEADKAEMSLAEYKLYLCEKINSLPVHPWNMQDYVAVHISDEGLLAMKNDPEYEKWVLDCLRSNFQAWDPWSARNGGKIVIFHFGATREECRVESWRPPSRQEEERERLFRKKAKDAFWERRRRRRKALLALYDELAEKKALSKRMAVSEYYAELAALPPEAETIPPSECEARAMQIYSSFKANILLRMFSIKNQKL